MEFSCPECNVLLLPQMLENMRLWKCPSCKGLAISVPLVRKQLSPEAFKKIWQKLYSDETQTGRPCPACKNPLSVVGTQGRDNELIIDVCRGCQVLWFDDSEFSDLPKVEHKEQEKSEVLSGEELVFAAFKEEQQQRRSLLFKLLDIDFSKAISPGKLPGGFFDD